ncbi:MAG: hypothetical protein J6S13_03590 [Clostridia bacterium]|nr:hypothetical protein [Clostridia bacterium]
MFINCNNECFNYHGRWEKTNNGYKSHWVRPYVEFFCDADFGLKLGDGSGEYSVFVDGEKVNAEDGVYKLCKKSLVRLTANETAHTVTFKGVETEGSVGFVPSRKQNILFIGDSLTHSAVSHSVIIPRELDCDYTCIAQGSMALCVDRGYVKVKEELTPFKGMSAAFFYLTSPCEGRVPMVPFDFENERKYDKIIIQIGTNDHLTDESYVDGFVTVYREFVRKIIGIYGDTPVFLALPSADTVDGSGWRRNTIERCAKEAEAQYGNATYISSRGWDVEISSDNVHPTTQGYATYAYELLKHLR